MLRRTIANRLTGDRRWSDRRSSDIMRSMGLRVALPHVMQMHNTILACLYQCSMNCAHLLHPVQHPDERLGRNRCHIMQMQIGIPACISQRKKNCAPLCYILCNCDVLTTLLRHITTYYDVCRLRLDGRFDGRWSVNEMIIGNGDDRKGCRRSDSRWSDRRWYSNTRKRYRHIPGGSMS